MTAPPQLGWVLVICGELGLTVEARLSDQRPDVSAGYGGWTEVARPRRRPLSVWSGAPGLRMTVGILLDGFRSGTSVEADVAKLEKMATASSALHEPPTITLKAKGGHVPHQNVEWVIDQLAWQDGAAMNKSGDRTRQGAILSLFEHLPVVPVHSGNAAQKARAANKRKQTKPGAKHKRVTVKRKKTIVSKADAGFGLGQDLLTIAAVELGDATRWTEIADLNGIRDPRAIDVGQVLRLP